MKGRGRFGRAVRFAAMAVLIAVSPAAAETGGVPTIGGVHELCIGVPDLLEQAQYWQQFGYRIGKIGELDADGARALYGVDSAVRSVRLYHQDSDHGLIRLMQWEWPLGEGLGMSTMKVVGCRWGAMLTSDVFAIGTHAQAADAAGLPVLWIPPQKQVVYAIGKDQAPFISPDIHAREAVLIQPYSRQILFQRYGYSIPLYGKINEHAHFPTSQVTHAGLVIRAPHSVLDFYEDGLGLKRVQKGELQPSTYDDPAPRHVFGLLPEETYTNIDYDDPRSVPDQLDRIRSGRLKVIIFPEGTKMEDRRSSSRPGHLGLTLYTYRVKGIGKYAERVREAGATGVTEVLVNEFGESSLSFTAPDGYFWTLVE